MLSITSCGGGSSSSPDANNNVQQSIAQDDETSLRPLEVTFAAPERLRLIGSALTATVTAGGSEQIMETKNGEFSSTLQLPRDQQLQVYVGIRRAEDGLLLAAADTTAWLGDEGSTVTLPEQLFGYLFDQDGDGVTNIIEIERGTSPTTLSLDFDADGSPDDSDQDDDDDGVPDEIDAFPTDATETQDTDADGIGDNQDTDADGNGIEDDQEDSDYDGVPDPIDLYPNDYYESADADGDGIGDNADPDDNNDGVYDYREGSQIIIPYVDNASISIDGRWTTGYRNNTYYDEWGKAVDDDSYGYSLNLGNLLVDNTDRGRQYNYGDNFEIMHDGEYLYIKISISDEELNDWFNDSANIWDDDSVELYIDVGNDKPDEFGDDDFQRLFRFRDDTSDPTIDGFNAADGMVTEHVTSYRHENNANAVYQQLYEIRVSLSSIGLEPGDTFGFDVAVNTDNDGDERDTKWGWWAPVGIDIGWQTPSVFGQAKLQPAD